MSSDGDVLGSKRMANVKRWSIHGFQAGAVLSAGLAAFGPPDWTHPAAHAAFTMAVGSLAFGVYLGIEALRRVSLHQANMLVAAEATRRTEELFSMTDMLQAAEAHDDAGIVLRATCQRLLPQFSGALYVFNNSRDRLDLTASWSPFEGAVHPEVLHSANCWALKRGKPHINDPSSHTLCCNHQFSQTGTVEVPMMARNELHGLLVFAAPHEGSFDQLMEIRRLARAVADSMSLALSNIALREKLRSQSLRDPLTGLYNRRYMEDALERYMSLAERSGAPTAVAMIDLDNFKSVNDQFGHAKGDAVLRDVASQIVSALRPSDVVARFGGEELMVILPNCSLEDAQTKCEILRERIASLSDAHDVPVSASFGVAAVPETSISASDVVPMADGALYVAKKSGKNCVRTAERRAGKEDSHPRLAVG